MALIQISLRRLFNHCFQVQPEERLYQEHYFRVALVLILRNNDVEELGDYFYPSLLL